MEPDEGNEAAVGIVCRGHNAVYSFFMRANIGKKGGERKVKTISEYLSCKYDANVRFYCESINRKHLDMQLLTSKHLS